MNYVFVLENDPSARNGLVRLLTAAGKHVRDYATLEDFLAALEPGMRGCLVLDSELPGNWGKELLKELKSQNVKLSIIMVSARDDRMAKRRSREMQAIGFFRKPVDGTAIVDAIEWALDVKKTNNNNPSVKSS